MTNTVLIHTPAPAFNLAHKAFDSAQALFQTQAAALAAQPVAASQPYPCLTAGILSNMGVRAQRLLRADY